MTLDELIEVLQALKVAGDTEVVIGSEDGMYDTDIDDIEIELPEMGSNTLLVRINTKD